VKLSVYHNSECLHFLLPLTFCHQQC
jgi:hypothetical protein